MDRASLIQSTSKTTQSQTGAVPSSGANPNSTGGRPDGNDMFDKWALGIEEPEPPASPPLGVSPQLPGASSGNSPAATRIRSESQPRSVERIRPDDVWFYLRLQYQGLDWSAPSEAMKTITQSCASTTAFTPSSGSVSSIPDDSLSAILTPTQIENLLLIFVENYTPWLNFKLIRDAESPLLDLVCCTIAARHLDENTRAAVAFRLQTLTQDRTAKLIFQSRRSASLEAIQCLLILSLWAPVSSPSEDFGDGRLLIASAISMAMNLRLNEAPNKAAAMLSSQTAGETIDEIQFLELLDKTRLWMSLSNAESLLCIGSGRGALSQRDPEAYIPLFRLRENLPTDKIGGGDTRLRLLADLYGVTERGLTIKFVSLAEKDVNEWYRSNEGVRREFSQLQRIVQPLGSKSSTASAKHVLSPVKVLAQADKFYFQILLVLLHSCRLLSIYNAMAASKIYFVVNRMEGSAFWYRTVRPYDNNVLLEYSKECLRLCETVLLDVIQTDVHHLGTCPDHIFLLISFAASFLVGCKFMILSGMHRLLPGSTDAILSSCIGHLRRAAYSTDHPASQCANVISMLVSLWENKETVLQRYQVQTDPSGSPVQASQPPNGDSASFTAHPVPVVHPSASLLMEPTVYNQADFSWLNDPGFWNDILDTPL
ncbi:hypothetical protein PQX77_016876 [Marasmius sp. AFHP31]|nr:hypothetical protein PQX77_016876 [Marasmius sp. AFHP31]